MEETNRSPLVRASTLAFVAAALFTIRFIFFFLPKGIQGQVGDGTLPGALLALAEHLVMFPVIAALPAPRWAKAAGYGWLVIDMSTDIMALNGISSAIYLPLRFGDHLSAALWTIAASWQAGRAILIVGLLYALDLASYSYLAAYGVPPAALIPSAILLPLWLLLVGRLLAQSEARQAREVKASAQQSSQAGG